MSCKVAMRIYTAAKEGNLKKLQALIRSSRKEDVKTIVESKPFGVTPLVLAARHGHVDVVQFLIEFCDADVESTGCVVTDNGVTIEGASPLWCAAAVGRLDIVEYLVKKSANVNSTTLTNSTPLRAACFCGYTDIAKYLVENNADIEIANRWGSTCLIVSCYKGHTDIVRHLLGEGADVSRKDNSGNTALYYCAESGNQEIMEILVQHGTKMENESCIDFTNGCGKTCLMTCCYEGHTDVVRYLLSTGADVNIRDLKGSTALHHCAGSKSGSQDIMELLLQHEARLEENNEGITPLFLAAETGHAHLVEYLMKSGEVKEFEHVEALEILGTTLFFEKKDITGALQCWELALLRRSNPQDPITKSEVWSWVATYTGAKELETLEELEKLKSDPDPVKITMQCVLLMERILGPIYSNTTRRINQLGTIYANEKGDFKRCVALWMYALDTQMNKHEYMSETTHYLLHRFAHLCKTLMDDQNVRSIKLIHKDIYEVFSKAVIELERGREALMTDSIPSMHAKDNFSRLIKTIMHLMSSICRLSDFCAPPSQEDKKFKTLVKKLIEMDPRTSKDETMLHLAVQESTTHAGDDPASKFPCIKSVKLLTSLGMPLSSIDEGGKTAYDIVYNDYNANYELLVELKCSQNHA